MTETTTGKVQKYFPKTDNKPHSIYIGEDRFSTFKDDRVPSNIQENDEVRIKWYKNEKGYPTIESCEKVNTDPSTPTKTENNDSARSDTSSKPMTTDERITRQVAAKIGGEVTATVLEHMMEIEDLSQPEMMETVVKVAKNEGLKVAEEYEEWLNR